MSDVHANLAELRSVRTLPDMRQGLEGGTKKPLQVVLGVNIQEIGRTMAARVENRLSRLAYGLIARQTGSASDISKQMEKELKG